MKYISNQEFKNLDIYKQRLLIILPVIREIGQVTSANVSHRFNKQYLIDVKNQIIITTSYLPNNCKFTERLYHVVYGLTSRPLCKNCKSKEVKYISFIEGYRIYCSKKCASSDPDTVWKVLSKRSKNQQKKKENLKNNQFLNEFESKSIKEQRVILKQLIDRLIKEYKEYKYLVQYFRKDLVMRKCLEISTEYLDSKEPRISERVYHITHNLFEIPICSECNMSQIEYQNYKVGYRSFCSNECSKSYVKRRDSNITNYLSRKEIIKQLGKIEEKDIINLSRQISSSVEYKFLKESIIETTNYLPEDCKLTERLYQIQNNLTSRPLCKRCKTNYTNFIRFTEGYFDFCSTRCSRNHPDTIQKLEQTWQENWGVVNPMKAKVVQEKIKQTWRENWGVDNPMKCSIPREKVSRTQLSNNYKYMSSPERIGEDYELVTPLEEYKSIKYNYLKFKHKKCNHVFEYCIANGQKPHCPKCYTNMSLFEEEVREFCKQYFEHIIYNTRRVIPPREIDIYIPELNLAIECNGVYWHREEIKGKDYHREKFLECAKQKIRLIQIFEDEWKHKRELVESYLLNAFGKSETIVDASQCEIVEVPQKFAEEFLNLCHLEGTFTGTHYGLTNNNNLVSLISVAPINYKQYNLGIYRFCDFRNTKVIGGLQKLVAHIKTVYNYPKIATYIDLRYVNIAKDFIAAGFKYVETTDPTFSYTKYQKRYTQPKTVEEAQLLVENYDEYKSIDENLIDNNFFKIYDSGYAIFELI